MRDLTVDLPRPIGSTALAGALRDAVARGHLCGGTPLPSTRTLAENLGVSRGVVVEAYERLIAEGRLVAKPGSGTAVALSPTIAWTPPPPQTATRPTRRPLRPGVPDLGLFPHKEWRRASDRAMNALSDADLDYPDPVGVMGLRIELCSYLGRVRAARVEPSTLEIVSGAAQGFSLLAHALLALGIDRIGVEDPGAVAVRQRLMACGLSPVPIPVDDRGLQVENLAAGGVRAVFITPAHQFPLGSVLSPERRKALISWARTTGGYIVEDDYDAEFRYDRDPIGCVQGIAPEVTALVGSVSKVLAPALRLGWMCVPPALLPLIAKARATSDLGVPTLPQLTFAELLSSGGYDKHARRSRRIYRSRRDHVVSLLDQLLPECRIEGVAAGLHLVARLPDHLDDQQIVLRAEALGLGPLALSTLYCDRDRHRSGLVIGYAGHSSDQLTSAVSQLGSVVRAVVTTRQ